jgi:hypothetical protein
MRRSLLISLSLILALAAWTTVWAQDDGFYVISGVKRNFAPVPKTGQTTPYAPGDDGTLQKGLPSPTSRFTDNANGTVTDNLTGLIWLKDANTFGVKKTWAEALSAAATLASGTFNLTDGSQAGDWRLPNLRELQSLIDYGQFNPPLPATPPFTGVQPYFYWSSTTDASNTTLAWDVDLGGKGVADGFDKTIADDYVWCVRGGQ